MQGEEAPLPTGPTGLPVPPPRCPGEFSSLSPRDGEGLVLVGVAEKLPEAEALRKAMEASRL